MSQNCDEGLYQDDFGTRDQDDSEERCTTHRSFGVVQESIDPSIVQLVRVRRDEEVACWINGVSTLSMRVGERKNVP